uniref:Uncharacterized protein n=1 Tax=Siphoviridae sp. ctbrg2 TaxID=2823589 RepID=A0A8S5LG77_9CAUD|nr:MAG TPA: hypothetical protein [Siphoviridae sp. ctbrg2]
MVWDGLFSFLFLFFCFDVCYFTTTNKTQTYSSSTYITTRNR